MDPVTALRAALAGSPEARRNYNEWVTKGGFQAVVQIHPSETLWMAGVRSVSVRKIGTKNIHGTHPMSGRKVIFRKSAVSEVLA